ncbi:glycosyltransferase family 4 protein [Lentimicrobium sp. L6]|uniref:glycosyltransferase family 4 protein n=1 Tax=Lentimicrobium sp. L6 TaxID=2735916 RepID=UPI001555957D|nr:glycosyltransferase family 4 protein [Lentimicrobium sp. L6]NPD83311.1 glycosyltransferase family 4 protein [Lentimicrobium sp. L6]
MNILVINHYAGSPDLGMEFRPYFMAKEWIAMGHDVTILASNQSHIRAHQPEVKKDFEEVILDGIRYVWVKTRPYEGNGVKRVLNIFDFVRKIYSRSKQISKQYQPDIVIASSTYTSDNYAARRIAKLAKAKYAYEVHDLWPLSPIELGGMSRKHPFIMAMQHAEDFAYRHSDIIISMLPKTQDYMKSRGLDLKKWHYVPNGFSVENWNKRQKLNPKTRKSITEIKTKFSKILAYTGTLGLANALDTLLDACHKIDSSVAVVIVGKGPEKEVLERRIEKENLSNCFILDSVTKNEIPELLSLFDFLFIGLKYQPLFRFGISPNKMIDYMMAAKPVIQSIDAGNNMVEDAQCGISIQPEDSAAIVKAVAHLIQLPETDLLKLGKNGRRFAEQHHDYRFLAKKFIDIISE